MTGSINGAFWVFAGQIALGQLPPCLLGVWLGRNVLGSQLFGG